MADLPPSRLQIDTHPFAYCGVDYFGPLLVKQRRFQVKRYGCLFTCLTSRAIHIEDAMDLTTNAFINALRRFLSRRGPLEDVVLLVDDSIPGSQWRLGKVIKLFPDKEGLVRQVVVKTRGSEVRRPVHKLCLGGSRES